MFASTWSTEPPRYICTAAALTRSHASSITFYHFSGAGDAPSSFYNILQAVTRVSRPLDVACASWLSLDDIKWRQRSGVGNPPEQFGRGGGRYCSPPPSLLLSGAPRLGTDSPKTRANADSTRWSDSIPRVHRDVGRWTLDARRQTLDVRHEPPVWLGVRGRNRGATINSRCFGTTEPPPFACVKRIVLAGASIGVHRCRSACRARKPRASCCPRSLLCMHRDECY